MSNSKFVQGYRKLIETLKPMTFTQRVDHLWTYYKEYFFAVVISIFVLALIISGIINAQVELLFCGVIANVDMTDAGQSYLDDGFYDHIGGGDWQDVQINPVYFEYLSNDVGQLDYNYYTAIGTIGMIETKKLDYIICDKNALEFYIQQDIMMDLRNIFTPEELADMEKYLIYIQVEGTDERYPAALDMKYIPFAQENIQMKEPVYLTFVVNTQKPERCRVFWEYLMAWQPDDTATKATNE